MQIELPVPLHDIGIRGPYVSPGTYKVTLTVDGDTTSRSFEVRGDPIAKLTTLEQKARETFLMDVQAQQIRTEKLAADIRAQRLAATGAEATRLQALERRLTAGREAPRGKLSSIASAFNGSGAQQGSLSAPTGQQRRVLAEAKAELTAVEKEAKQSSTKP
jgi:PKD repeat protein